MLYRLARLQGQRFKRSISKDDIIDFVWLGEYEDDSKVINPRASPHKIVPERGRDDRAEGTGVAEDEGIVVNPGLLLVFEFERRVGGGEDSDEETGVAEDEDTTVSLGSTRIIRRPICWRPPEDSDEKSYEESPFL